MKGFFAIVVVLILASTCILGSIAPQDEEEGTGFGIIGMIFIVILIAAACIANREHSRFNESIHMEKRCTTSAPSLPEEFIQQPAQCGENRQSKPPL